MEECRLREEADRTRVKFYKNLEHQLFIEKGETENPNRLLRQAEKEGIITALQKWDFHNLDDNGDTQGLQERMRKVEDVFDLGDARRKHEHLAPE